MDKETIIIGGLIATVFLTIFVLAFASDIAKQARIAEVIRNGSDPLVASCAYGG